MMKDMKGTFFAKYTGYNIVTINGAHWKSQRMIANPAFHHSMPVKLFGRLTQVLFKVIGDDEVVDIADLLERWTLDAIGKAGFGKYIQNGL